MIDKYLSRYKDAFQTLCKAWLEIILNSKNIFDVKITLNMSWNLLVTGHFSAASEQETII